MILQLCFGNKFNLFNFSYMKIKRINIGEIIRDKVLEKGISKAAFAKSIGIQRQNIEKTVFERISLDTELLCRISEQLECNLFSYYQSEDGCNTTDYDINRTKKLKATVTIDIEDIKQEKVIEFVF